LHDSANGRSRNGNHMIYLAILSLSITLSLTLTPLAANLGRRWGMVDHPGGRRQHSGIIPRTGGLAIFLAFGLTVGATLLLPILFPTPFADWLPPRNDVHELRKLTALLLGATFCTAAGFLDDRYKWSSVPQYFVQVAAALIAISGFIFLKHINSPIQAEWLTGNSILLGGADGLAWWLVWPLTIFWFVGMMNTVNFLDGLNGLVAGVTAILCIVLAIHMIFRAEEPQLSVAILPIALLGAVLGFLPFNFSPARLFTSIPIFMGSSGSYFLGFTIAALGIIGGARVAAVMLVLGLPILDVAWLIWQRTRRGRSPNQAGRDHLHFRLLDKGINARTIVFGYWIFCAIFGTLTLTIDSRLYKLVALIGLGVVGLGVLVWANSDNKVTKTNRMTR